MFALCTPHSLSQVTSCQSWSLRADGGNHGNYAVTLAPLQSCALCCVHMAESFAYFQLTLMHIHRGSPPRFFLRPGDLGSLTGDLVTSWAEFTRQGLTWRPGGSPPWMPHMDFSHDLDHVFDTFTQNQ